jgi:hypothetical protein
MNTATSGELAVYRPTGSPNTLTIYGLPVENVKDEWLETLFAGGRIYSPELHESHPNVCEICGGRATTTGCFGAREFAFDDYQPKFVGHIYMFETCEEHKDVPMAELKQKLLGRRHMMSGELIAYLDEKRKQNLVLGGVRAWQVCLLCGGGNESCAVQQLEMKDGSILSVFFGVCHTCNEQPNFDELFMSQVRWALHFREHVRQGRAPFMLIELNVDDSPEEMQKKAIVPFCEALLFDERKQ